MSNHKATDFAIKMIQRQKDGDLEGDLKGDVLELEQALASKAQLEDQLARGYEAGAKTMEYMILLKARVNEAEALIREMMRVLDVLLEGDISPSDVVQAARLYNRAEDLVGPLEEHS